MSGVLEPGNRFSMQMDLNGSASPGTVETVAESGSPDLRCALYFIDIDVQKPGAGTAITTVQLRWKSAPLTYNVPAEGDPTVVVMAEDSKGRQLKHGFPAGATFTVIVAGDSEATFNATYTATAIDETSFSIPFDNDPDVEIGGDGTLTIYTPIHIVGADWQGTGMEIVSAHFIEALEAVSIGASGLGHLMVAGAWR